MREIRTSGLMSGDWKRNYGTNCDTGMGESRRQTVQPRSLRPPRQSSTLRFSKVAEGRYVGQRADLIGEANVVAHGNRIEITYRAHVPTKDGKTHDLNFKETFVFTQSGTADYQLHVSLLFVPVGDAHLTVRKRPG